MSHTVRLRLNTLAAPLPAGAASARGQVPQPGAVNLKNARHFNDLADGPWRPSQRLVASDVIQTPSITPIADPQNVAVRRFGGGGRTLLELPSMAQRMEGHAGRQTPPANLKRSGRRANNLLGTKRVGRKKDGRAFGNLAQ